MKSKEKLPSPLKQKPEPQDPNLITPEDLQEVEHLLAQIPADDYGTWFETGCALKHLGAPFDVFRAWSATSEKFDEAECAEKWEDLPEDPRAGWPTLRKNAAASSFVPVPEAMLPEPQTEDECVAQAARYIATTFKPHEMFEICDFEQKPNAKKPVPKRNMNLSALDDEDTEVTLCNDETLRSWILGVPFGGVVVSINSLKIPDGFNGYAPTDECVSDHRLVLVECDKLLVEEQWSKLKQMRLPIKSIVSSAGKSLHVRCYIDAGNDPALYKERVNKLYEYVRRFGFIPDENCKNASRPTRLPGALRNGKRQYLVCGPCGYPDWETFEACELSQFKVTTKSSPGKGATPHEQCDRSTRAVSSCSPEEMAILDKLEKECDLPFTLTAKGNVAQITEPFWGRYVAHYHGLMKIGEVIWRYCDETGVWSPVDLEDWIALVVETAHHYAEIMDGYKDLVSRMTVQTCKNLMTNVPKMKVDPFKTRPKNVIHAGNGMVEISKDGTCTLKPYDRKYFSQSRCDIAFNPAAKCPRFINDLLKPQLEDDDDLNSLLRYGAQCILPGNDIQKFLVISGTPGGGKDTFVNIIRAIVGHEYCSELRKGHLADRFELGSCIGSSLLLGCDVDSDFLLGKDAGTVKKLCGGNLVEAEIKNVTQRFKLEGHFKILITSNNVLQVRQDGDMGAWGRRMLIVPFVGKEPETPIYNFHEVLLAEEGEGILNLLIEKAAELIQHGFPKESRAHARAMRLLQHQSDPIGSFLSACVERADSGPGITKEKLEEKYTEWCEANSLPTLVGDSLPKKLAAGMGAIFHVSEAHSVGTKRGFHGVAFKADDPQSNG